MDPNETLRELRELAHDGAGPLDMTEADRMAELFHALDNWLRRGGFPPDDWRIQLTSVIPEREAEARKRQDEEAQ